jgi:hypothetical protein
MTQKKKDLWFAEVQIGDYKTEITVLSKSRAGARQALRRHFGAKNMKITALYTVPDNRTGNEG